jgi:hypothetical protein
MDWRGAIIPDRVVDAAAEHGLGALLTAARATHLTLVVRVVVGVVTLVVGFNVGLLLMVADRRDALLTVLLLVIAGFVVRAVLALTGPVLYLFERGAIVATDRKRPLQVVPRTELVPIETERRPMPFGGRRGWVAVLDVRGPQGSLFVCDSHDAVRLADVLASVEVPAAVAALRSGHPLFFGPITLTPHALVIGQLTVPWADDTQLRTTDTHLVLGGARDVGPLELVQVPRPEVPHQRTLIAVANQVAAETRLTRTG